MSSAKENSDSSKNEWLQNLRDSIAILGGMTAVFVAMLWYVGRQYAKAYFMTMNIPWSQINLSLWEYGEMAWPFISIGLIILAGLIVAIIYRFSSPPVFFRLKSFKSLIVVYALIFAIYGLAILVQASQAFISIIAVGAMLTFIFISSFDGWSSSSPGSKIGAIMPVFFLLINTFVLIGAIAHDVGISEGQNFVARNALKVHLTLTEPLLSDAPTNSRPSTNGSFLFDYEDFYLLQYNEGRYFLFKQINAQCQPEKVYAIKEVDIRSIDYVSLTRPKCLPNAVNAQPIPTPDPSPTPNP